ncbi:tautomerase family protein [Aerococcaceae bacterium DSM 111020]|nr:tautomerase family protein [Aerococcaceae bacterium DSM 111020]
MPFVRIQLKAGRTPEQKETLAKEIIELMTRTDFASKDSIRVIYEEMEPENFYRWEDIEE